VDDEDVVPGVHSDPDRGAEDPVIGKRLGPEGIDFEHRRLDALSLGCFEDGLPHSERHDQRDQRRSQHQRAWTNHDAILLAAEWNPVPPGAGKSILSL
jgi:hypothetical protein